MTRSGEFLGTDRFLLRRKIGSGGMGAVYEVYDRERGDTVALKSLLWADAFAIYRLKEEFRALAGVAHTNLVTLYELVATGDEWFFTMELVDGVDFMRYVRPDTGDDKSPLDMGRLRAALPQLAEGVHHLHRAGKLHRDIKPPNVLVTQDHRVVILDFGIASDARRGESPKTRDEGIAGTAFYMAPEQVDGESGTASDWYAVGTMLYEALTGRLPFSGSAIRVLMEKKEREAPSPAAHREDLPPDLVGLCVELLRRDPRERPSGEAILARLGVLDSASVEVTSQDGAGPVTLVGRGESLSRLTRALEEVRQGSPVAVYVYGPSGIGKSALVQHFLEHVAGGGATVLAGRCYERESVPYKALDGVVDSLTRLLRNLPANEIEALIPPDASTLARVFPVLSRVELIAGAPLPDREIPDPREMRRRAFAALREMLVRLAARYAPLVLYIDDLHWADADSATLLDALLLRPEAPNLLLITSFRSEEIPSNPALRDMLSRVGTPGYDALPLGPLSESDSRVLARTLLHSLGGDTGGARAAEAVVREAGGSPFLAEQLARYLTLSGVGQEDARIGFRGMLEARLEALPEGAQRLLHVLAVAGRPVAATAAREAAGLTGDERPMVAMLAAQHLVRATGSPPRLEFYHDRLREGLSERVSASDAKRTHLVIAQVLERRGADPDVLYDHYFRAGEGDRARNYAVLAAEKATAAFAFDHAVTYYERALAIGGPGTDLVRLERGLGDALASAGRGARAARAYLDAASRSDPADTLELQRRAAQQLLVSGHLDEGLGVIRTVLASVGLKLAATPGRALFSLIVRRLQLRLRGLRFSERPVEVIPPADITRIDTCWAVAVGLGLVDNIRAADFQTRHTLLALAAGEPHRIARALAIEAGFQATGGGPARERAQFLFERAKALAERIQSPYGLALSTMISGVNSYYLGQWRTVYESASRAARTLAEEFSGVAWELSTARLYQVYSLFYLGDFPQHGRLARAYLRDALDRGNLFAATIFRSGLGNVAWLVTDQVDEARRMAREAAESWPREEFRIPHFLAMLADGQLALYSGEGAGAETVVQQAWPGFQRSHLTRIQNLRINAVHLRARGGLVAARRDPRVLGAVERDIALIERERMPWADALAVLLRAGVAAARRDTTAAVRLLSEAETRLSAQEMAMYAAAAQRRRGQIIGGDEGRALIGLADATMTARAVVNPGRMTGMLAPGFSL